MDVRTRLLTVTIVLATSCAPKPPPRAPSGLAVLTEGATVTVVELFSATCPCQAAHDRALVELIDEYRPRGVRFLVLDAEVGRTQSDDDVEAERRGYPVSIRRDEGAVLARALGAEYATHSFVFDRAGRTRYAGGIDDAHDAPTPESRPYLRDAIDAVLAGNDPPTTEAKTLGCLLTLP